LTLGSLDLLGRNSTHVILDIINAKGLKQGNQGLVIRAKLFGDHVHPKFAHRTSDN
jgi:hypothetical protein